MTFPNFVEKYGSLSATGFAKETTFGTAVAASTFLPMMSNTMEEDPGWFAPHLMQGIRDYQVYNLYGEAKFQGAVTGPIFPSNAIQLLSGAVGPDAAVGYGVVGTIATPTSTTLNGSTTSGATTVTVASATGFATGQEIVIDTGQNTEVRKITNVAGSVITVADALYYAHATGVAAVTGTTTTVNGALTAPTSTVVVTSATGITNGTFIQIDVNSVAGSTTSEVRKVTNVVTNTLTLDQPITYNHANGSQVIIVTTPYMHTFAQANTLPSLTVEKNLGGFQSLQFAGCRVGKLDLKAPVGNTAVEFTTDFSGQSVNVLNSPTAISVINELPFVFAEANLNFYGTLRTDVTNVNAVIDNGLKETYTYANLHGPAFITPLIVHGSGSVDVVFDSLNDATYGDFNRLANGTLGQLQFSLVHPANGGTISFFYPQVAINKYANDLKQEEVVMSALTWEATRPLTGPAQFTVQAVVFNSTYLPY